MIIIEYMFPAIYAQRDSIRLCVPLKTIANWGSHRAVHRSDLLRVSGRSFSQIVIASRLISSAGPERLHGAAWWRGHARCQAQAPTPVGDVSSVGTAMAFIRDFYF